MKLNNKKAAPAFPVNAASRTLVSISHGLRRDIFRESERAKTDARSVAPIDFDYGPISRAEMRDIVIEMIG
jgi:hypothetical protein